jgi:hypothetical protein
VLATPLPRIVLHVAAAETGGPLNLVTIDWQWNGGPPHMFVPVSRYWHAPAKDGRYEIVVPEGAVGATVTAAGFAPSAVTTEQLADGAETRLALAPAR